MATIIRETSLEMISQLSNGLTPLITEDDKNSTLLDKEGRPVSRFNDRNECSICLTELKDIESGQITFIRHPSDREVFHPFHEPCIRTWLDCNRSCPICREEITTLQITARVDLNGTTEGCNIETLEPKDDNLYLTVQEEVVGTADESDRDQYDGVERLSLRAAIGVSNISGFMASLTAGHIGSIFDTDDNPDYFTNIGILVGYCTGTVVTAITLRVLDRFRDMR